MEVNSARTWIIIMIIPSPLSSVFSGWLCKTDWLFDSVAIRSVVSSKHQKLHNVEFGVK